MQTNFREVLLTPAPQPKHRNHKVYTMVGQNIDWYRGLAAHYGIGERVGKGRKNHKKYPPLRKQVITALERIIEGWIDPVARDLWLLQEIEESATRRGWVSEDEIPF
jgi:hypothetical protein